MDEQMGGKKALMRRIALWGSIVVGSALLVWGLIALAKMDQPTQEVPVPELNDITATDHISGLANSKVTLMEFGDYQCPACGMFYPVVSQVVKDYSNRIRFVFRNFPLPQHANARAAAYAAEAAGLQGKYWEFYDRLYGGQQAWAEQPGSRASEIFSGYARDLKLDSAKFDKDRGSADVRQKVDNDYQSGARAKVDATPTFFLNGLKIRPQSYDEFKQLLDAALAANP